MGAQLPFYFLFVSKSRCYAKSSRASGCRQLCQSIVEFFHKRERNGQMLLAMPRFVSSEAHKLHSAPSL